MILKFLNLRMIYEVSSENVSMRAIAVCLTKNPWDSIWLEIIPICPLTWKLKYFWWVSPEARRTKGGDGSPVLVPPITCSGLCQHQINKFGPLWLAKYPVVVAVGPRLNLVNVWGEEAVKGVAGHNINSSYLIVKRSHRTTIKIRLESTMPFNWPWFSRG